LLPKITPNNDQWTPLNNATNNGHSEIIKLLLNAKANTEIPNEGGFTPLAQAVYQSHKEAVELLIHAGANPFKRSHNGKSILDLARTGRDNHGNTEIFEMINSYIKTKKPNKIPSLLSN
jgi:ankyrin repeat protein